MSANERRAVAEGFVAVGEDRGVDALTVARGVAEMNERRVRAVRGGLAIPVDDETFFANVRSRPNRQE